MANEAVLLQEYSLPVNFTCADAGTGIAQGAILKLSTPNTASLANGDANYVAGICQTEKPTTTSGDGTTSVSTYIDGVFNLYVSGSVTAGQAVMTSASTSGSNICVAATASAIGCKTLGIALADHSGVASAIAVRLQPGCNNTAYA